MKKIVITVAALVMCLNVAKAQNDSTSNRKLKIDEVNFITSYYHQDGNNSAVTGGIGSEKLDDFGNSIDLQLSRFDKKNNKHTFGVELGIDVYSSASSDKIDPTTISSASSKDVRISPSLNYLKENAKNNTALGGGVSFSQEFDYTSIGANVLFAKATKDKNREFSAKASVFLDTWSVILPVELRNIETDFKYKQGDNAPRNSYNLALGLSQVVNQRLQVSILTDIGYQTGLLGTAYQRVYFGDNGNNAYSEKLPDNRFKLPVGLRANYFLGDKFILRSFYRFYTDSWNLTAHTAELEIPYKITPFVSVAPFYRFYSQSGVDYFKPYKEHLLSDNSEFYTSDYDLSKFTSHLFGLNFRMVSANGLMGVKKLNVVELRYSYYNRSTDLTSHLITLALKFK
ncbi:DUF3570 domain-containing protein [Macellibacteroides fermentans]|jgi:hypothetical protein|uniref:DUF3570 domain-containing protein n=1 Tax=bioreactor metagenome TaxID=1076179 RepID=A0A644VLV3_9ZZZZ|nr:DUF3570 domain-containing protein [Bacteroidota bacterium]MEA4809226.1 DUF3570 domain-containing protein [Macellibacteroides fermentans]HNP89980.1 DUF3570 domain-containing protein [Macellibacteroides fermentans]